MRAPGAIVLSVSAGLVLGLGACDPKDRPGTKLLEPPASYDPVNTEGLTLGKAGVDKMTLLEGDEREAHIKDVLMAEGAFKGQAKCRSGSKTGNLDHSKWGEYALTCDAGTVLFDIELKYTLYTSRDAGKPLSANAYVEFGGTLVDFDYHDSSTPRSITAKVQVDDTIRRLE